MVDRCYYGEGHLVLMRYLFEKHSELYERHRDSVIQHQKREIRELEESAETLRRHVEDHLEKELSSKRRTIDELLVASGGRERDAVHVESELDAARFEIEALRSSLSWRITAPLRRLYELIGFARTKP